MLLITLRLTTSAWCAVSYRVSDTDQAAIVRAVELAVRVLVAAGARKVVLINSGPAPFLELDGGDGDEAATEAYLQQLRREGFKVRFCSISIVGVFPIKILCLWSRRCIPLCAAE